MKNKQKGFIVPLLIVIAVLVIGAGAYYFGFKKNNNNNTVTSEIPVNSESQSQIIVNTSNSNVSSTTAQATSTFPVQANIKTDIKITGTALQTVNCGSTDCFNQKFVTCSPATTDVSMGPVTFHYEILKSVTNGCQVSMEYTKNPNPAWVNKLMTCTFNNKADFESEVSRVLGNIQNDPNTCSGPLADALREMFNGTGPLSPGSSSVNTSSAPPATVPNSSNSNSTTNSSNIITVDGTSMTVSTVGTSFHSGSQVKISWSIQSGHDSIYLITAKGGNTQLIIATGLTGGTYTWTIPTSVPLGTYYIAVSGNNLQSGLMSHVFPIVTP